MFGTGLFVPFYQTFQRLVAARDAARSTGGVAAVPRELPITLNEYLDNMPNLHTWDEGVTWNTGGFSRYYFDPVHELLCRTGEGLSFIETGAGNSTIFLLMHSPARVVSIAPDGHLFDRIRSYCTEHGISDAPLEKYVEGSQWALPRIAARSDPVFDFALVDGQHGWPMVFVDFHYINYVVRPGGLIMLDDTQLHSVNELVKLLREQPGYEVALDMGKAIVFRKTAVQRELPDFGGQPYIVQCSNALKA
jgi:methyltransferase family protein